MEDYSDHLVRALVLAPGQGEAKQIWELLVKAGPMPAPEVSKLFSRLAPHRQGSFDAAAFILDQNLLTDAKLALDVVGRALSSGQHGVALKILSHEQVKQHICANPDHRWLKLPLETHSPAPRPQILQAIMDSGAEFPQRERDKGLWEVFKLSSQAMRQDGIDEYFECLIGIGANPNAYVSDENGSGISTFTMDSSVARALAMEPGKWGPGNGAMMLDALSRSTQWVKSLENGFAKTWLINKGSSEAIARALAVSSCVKACWWDGDRFNLLGASLHAALREGGDHLFEEACKRLAGAKVENPLPTEKIIPLAKDAIVASLTAQNGDELDDFFHEAMGESIDREKRLSALAEFWATRAPRMAPAFQYPIQWKSLCQRLSQKLAGMTGPMENPSAWIEAATMELQTRQKEKTSPSPRRRL